MRRVLIVSVLWIAGCSTAPVADFLDAVAPGRPESRSRVPEDQPPPRRPRQPADEPPLPLPRRDDPPPLPAVPSGVRPIDPDDEGESPSARLRVRD